MPRVHRRFPIGRLAGISEVHGKVGEKSEIFAERLPSRLDDKDLSNEGNQIMGFGEWNLRLTELSPPVFLGALLRVEADAMVSWLGFFRTRDSPSTMAKSPSALRTHSAVIGFLEHPPFFRNLPDEIVTHG